MTVDQATLTYYNQNASEAAAKFRSVDASAWTQQFREAFPSGGRVMDVGSGSGRDLAILLELGFDAYGCEPSEGMRRECVEKYPQLRDRLLPFGLPLPEKVDVEGTFDGVVCSAVLMHVPETERFNSAFSLKRLVREKGRLWISVLSERPGLNAEKRDEHGRLFGPVHPEHLILLFERLGFQLLRRWDEPDRLGRPGIRWNCFLFELDSTRGRPLDRIERVLNRDRKTATYKLALFRALSEIGTVQDHQAEWLPSGDVAVPLRLIATKWFRYYWPIFESVEFIPQNNGEKSICAKPVAFRRIEVEIIQAYRNRGGLSQFLVDEASGLLSESVRKKYERALNTISRTIKEGPVVYASGNMFRNENQRVVIHPGAWREFCQLGHWIEPAVVLRWAEETSRMSKGQVAVAEVLNRLVIDPTEERNVAAAKEVFDNMKEVHCVWSDKLLRTLYAVDHIIPFCLWHCNDLWNLLPCDASLNRSKSDRLPERALMFERKDAILFYWGKSRERHPRRFESEMLAFTGKAPNVGNWENVTFQRLVEAVETTAVQRGAERWRP